MLMYELALEGIDHFSDDLVSRCEPNLGDVLVNDFEQLLNQMGL